MRTHQTQKIRKASSTAHSLFRSCRRLNHLSQYTAYPCTRARKSTGTHVRTTSSANTSAHTHVHAHNKRTWHNRIAHSYAWVWGRFCAGLTRSTVCSHDLFSYSQKIPLGSCCWLAWRPRLGQDPRSEAGPMPLIFFSFYLCAHSVSSSLSPDA